jgi:hypothetical protein
MRKCVVPLKRTFTNTYLDDNLYQHAENRRMCGWADILICAFPLVCSSSPAQLRRRTILSIGNDHLPSNQHCGRFDRGKAVAKNQFLFCCTHSHCFRRKCVEVKKTSGRKYLDFIFSKSFVMMLNKLNESVRLLRVGDKSKFYLSPIGCRRSVSPKVRGLVGEGAKCWTPKVRASVARGAMRLPKVRRSLWITLLVSRILPSAS